MGTGSIANTFTTPVTEAVILFGRDSSTKKLQQNGLATPSTFEIMKHETIRISENLLPYVVTFVQ